MDESESPSLWEKCITAPAFERVASYALVLVVLLAAALWVAHRPMFDWHRVSVSGDISRTNLQAMKSQTVAALEGNFWSLNLHAAQRRFEQTPWVRRATLHRQFPDTLRVQIEEQVPAAWWQGEDSSAFVNGFGEVFEANAADIADDLPVFKGQENQSQRMMNMYVALEREATQRGLKIREIELGRGGAWSLNLDTGAHLELGRGSDRDLQARLQRFFTGLMQIYPDKPAREALLMIASADLRYQNGFSLRSRTAAAQQGQQ
jgi:cell division protein FtsQ